MTNIAEEQTTTLTITGQDRLTLLEEAAQALADRNLTADDDVTMHMHTEVLGYTLSGQRFAQSVATISIKTVVSSNE